MSKIFVQLNGGLGNQMFQYATARAMSLRNNSELILDNWSGFVRDYQYKRYYELGSFPIKANLVNPLQLSAIWFYRLVNKINKNQLPFIDPRWYGTFINENNYEFLKDLNDLKIRKSVWLTGYWQSPLYFNDFEDIIRQELDPSPSTQTNFQNMANQIINSDSVALGVRLYEESNSPNIHSRTGLLKTNEDIKTAIKKMIEIRPNSNFFVFCTQRSTILDDLNLPRNTVYVTHDDGFIGSIDRLWLLSKCKHHIFTNSSYYWWGAWLSKGLYKNQDQTIIAADNFLNLNSLCTNWDTF
jgi:hypothetical protein